MAKKQGKHPHKSLDAAKVRSHIAKKQAGRFADGGGLYLVVENSGAHKWIWRTVYKGKRRVWGVGGKQVSLREARERAEELAFKKRNGTLDDENKAPKVAAITFKAVAEEYIETKAPEWGNAKHASQWRNTLRDYAYPVIGGMMIDEVGTDDIHKLLNRNQLWLTKTETAKRVQGRIEKIFDYARVKKYCLHDNPARWRGYLSEVLPTPSKIAPVTHHRALPHSDAPALLHELQALDTPASRALILTLLCATRSSETLNARRSEIDLDNKMWVVPRERMKAKKEHHIPLSEAAVALLKRQMAATEEEAEWLFPGQKRGKPLSNMAMTNVLKRIGWLDRTTVHGLRSTFRDWINDETSYPGRLAEVALAHQLDDKAEKAYSRSVMIEKRRKMMGQWADYCAGKSKVVSITKLGSARTG